MPMRETNARVSQFDARTGGDEKPPRGNGRRALFGSSGASNAVDTTGQSHSGKTAAIRLLTLTGLFPSSVRPRHGIFVETRLRKLMATGEATADVIAPVPWFPSTSARFGAYGTLAATPAEEDRDGLHVRYPRYFMLPGIGAYFQPWSLEHTFMRAIASSQGGARNVDVVDAHYFYPDGVAAVNVARRLNLPVVVTARGSDINLLGALPWYRRQIVDAAQRADHVIAVSEALKRVMCGMGIDEARITVLRNGVDLDRFAPVPRPEARARLGIRPGPVVLSVGNLVPEKGHDLVIDAVSRLPGATLVIVGAGPELARLRERASARGMGTRIDIRGVVPQDQLNTFYAAADVLALGSTREGWPNVVLESMASGTPVVATAVGGVPEMIWGDHAGVVVPDRSPERFAEALAALLASPRQQDDVRAHAAKFDWDVVCRQQLDVYRMVIAKRMAAR